MEVVNMSKELSTDSRLSWDLLHAIVELDDEKLAELREDSTEWRVHLEINGIELKFSTIMDHFAEQFNHAVDQHARQLIEEHIGSLHEQAGKIVDKFQEGMSQLVGQKWLWDGECGDMRALCEGCYKELKKEMEEPEEPK